MQQDQFLGAQKTLKYTVLRPLAESAQSFQHFGAPPVIWDVVSDHVQGLIGFAISHSSASFTERQTDDTLGFRRLTLLPGAAPAAQDTADRLPGS